MYSVRSVFGPNSMALDDTLVTFLCILGEEDLPPKAQTFVDRCVEILERVEVSPFTPTLPTLSMHHPCGHDSAGGERT